MYSVPTLRGNSHELVDELWKSQSQFIELCLDSGSSYTGSRGDQYLLEDVWACCIDDVMVLDRRLKIGM